MAIGERIRQIRKEKGITQKRLAELTGIAEITIRQYEAGKYKPKSITIHKIAKALGVSACDLDEQLIVNKPLCEYTTKELLEEIERRVNIHGF